MQLQFLAVDQDIEIAVRQLCLDVGQESLRYIGALTCANQKTQFTSATLAAANQ